MNLIYRSIGDNAPVQGLSLSTISKPTFLTLSEEYERLYVFLKRKFRSLW
jgi:hypothetical protein